MGAETGTRQVRTVAVNRRAHGWFHVAWAAAVECVLALNVVSPLPGHEDEWPWVLGLMAFPVAGALVLITRPGNVVGRLLAVVGAAAGAIFVLSWYVQTVPGGPLSRQLEAITNIPAVLQFGGMLALLHLFPTGRPRGHSHARLVAVLWWYVAAFAVLGVVRPGPLELTGRPNPFGVGPLWLRDVVAWGAVGVPVFVALGVVVVAARWRRANPVERAQLKWFSAAAAWVLLVATLLAIFEDSEFGSPTVELVGGLVVASAFWSLPLAVMVAVTRYSLFEIDRVISRTVAYALLAGVIGVVYGGSVVGLQAVLPVGGSELAVAASTLAAAAVFGPIRGRIQRAVDRRFDRARYDADRELAAFTRRLRGEVDLDTVAAETHGVVTRTMAPSTFVLWTPPPSTR